jgi:DNA (cytosine-5)-methyltransferase 1
MYRFIRELKPTWIVGENVFGLVNWSGGMVLEEVCTDLEALGYKVQPVIVPACAVNAPHRRDRIWFVAYSESARVNREHGDGGGKEKEEDRERPTQLNGACESRAYKNPNSDGWTGEQREEEPDLWELGNVGSGDNERLRTDNAEIGIASDTSGQSSERVRLEQREPGQQEQGELGGDGGQVGDGGDVAIARSIGLQCKGRPTELERRGFSVDNPQDHKPNWDNFPTQSPICSRDDGFSERLDLASISYPKWRNESIKAAGNAVVPQVVHELFKVIEAMNNGSDI